MICYHLRVINDKVRMKCFQLGPVTESPGHAHGVGLCIQASLHIRIRIPKVQALLRLASKLLQNPVHTCRIRLLRDIVLLPGHNIKISFSKGCLNILYSPGMGLVGKNCNADSPGL